MSSAALSAVPTGWWMYGLAALALLAAVKQAGRREGALDEVAVGLGVVALDGREELVEQGLVLLGDVL